MARLLDDGEGVSSDSDTPLLESSVVIDPDIQQQKRKIRWYHNVGDFFNCLKAFIGTNYQALPFAFSKSGLALGILGVLLIATLNDHCVQLLIRSKNYIIHRICTEKVESGDITLAESELLRARLQLSMSYADLGRHAIGRGAYHVIMLAIWFTQYSTVISYYIFIGNTLYEIFPMVPRAVVIQNGTKFNQSDFLYGENRLGHGIPMLHLSNIGKPLAGSTRTGRSLLWMDGDQDIMQNYMDINITEGVLNVVTSNMDQLKLNPDDFVREIDFNDTIGATSSGNGTLPLPSSGSAIQNIQLHNNNGDNDIASNVRNQTHDADQTGTEIQEVANQLAEANSSTEFDLVDLLEVSTDMNPSSTITDHSMAPDLTTIPHNTSTSQPQPLRPTVDPDVDKISSAPDLRLIMLFPLPFFILTSLIRQVRYFAPFSSVATVALAIGAFSVLGFIIADFKITDDFTWWKLKSLPLFLGQLIGAYEGIGCVIPIQSSMEGNRHLFPWFIHGAVTIVFFILCTFGILGYLAYGNTVAQIIVTNIPQHSVLAVLVDVTLVISVLFTYPLQCYPVIEILETYVFSSDGCSSCSRPSGTEYNQLEDEDEVSAMLSERSIERSASRESHIIPPTISSWKRNILRILITLVSVGMAILLRNSYAYLSAFTGAVGASLLALIFPCLIHLTLKWNHLSNANLIKDCSIIAFAGVSSILTIIVITWTMVNGEA